jgi:hypothetical protein
MKNLVTVPKIFFSIDLKPPLLLPGEFLKKATAKHECRIFVKTETTM